MSILSEIKQQKHSLDDLAKLPQSLIMQMAQKKQIMPEMVAPILSRKAEMMDAVAKTKALQSAPQAMAQTSVLENLMARNAQGANPMPQQPQQQGGIPGVVEGELPNLGGAGLGQMQQAPQQMPQLAGGGIIAFKEGDFVGADDGEDEADDDFSRHQAYLNKIMNAYGVDENYSPVAKRVATPVSKPSQDVMVAMASPTSRTYEMERSSVAEKRPEETRPAVREVTKERVATNEPTKEAPKATKRAANHPYAGLVAQDAQKYGNDQSTVLKILNNETGGLKNPETAVSSAGAVGIAQFMPKTAKQYGVDPKDPKQASDAMNRHVHHLMKQYGDPKLVAIAYNWGEGNTNRWLRTGADPRMLPKETRGYLDKFMTTALASGGQVQGYAEGGAISQEPYASAMKRAFGYEPFHGPAVHKYAFGGQVQHFAEGETVKTKPVNPPGSVIGQELRDFFGNLYDKAGRIISYANPEQDGFSYSEASIPQNQAVERSTILQQAPKPAKIPPKPSTSLAPSDSRSNVAPRRGPTIEDVQTQIANEQAGLPSNNGVIRGAQDMSNADTVAGLGVIKEEAAPPPPAVDQMGNVTGPTAYDNLMATLDKQAQAVAQQRKEDRAYANIMAGLATMAGESPNAMTNIAKGQMAGVAYGSEARKQSAAEDARIMQLQGSVLRYKDANDIAREAKKETSAYYKKRAEIEELNANTNKTAKEEEHLRRLEDDAEKKRRNLDAGLTAYLRTESSGIQAKYKAKLAATKDIIDPDKKEKALADAEDWLATAEANLERNPVVLGHKKALYPDIDWDKVAPPVAPKVKTISLNDMQKKK
jgi:hypothetical protein